ncbi:MAG: SDR family oxidoreductase [Bdellovibrionales bacterium]|nr:SDR family oxidoreductase [Bdellovibrionales bacterium]
MSTHKRKTVIVTGASSGVGEALAKRLLKEERFNVIATARVEKTTETELNLGGPTPRLAVLDLDLTSHDSRTAFAQNALQCFGCVDVLINNAGISYRSVVEHMNRKEEWLQLETNYLGPLALIRKFLPHMRSRHSGRILNISSVAGVMAMPTMSSYSASKFALEGASEALWYELKPWNISVSCLQLGFVKSDSYLNVYLSEKAERSLNNPEDPYHLYYRCMGEFVERLMHRSLATPESIANAIIRVIERESLPLRVPITLDAHFFFWLRRIFPRRLYHTILYRNLPSISRWEEAAQKKMQEVCDLDETKQI